MRIIVDTDRLFKVIQDKYESYIYFDQLEKVLKEVGVEADAERSTEADDV